MCIFKYYTATKRYVICNLIVIEEYHVILNKPEGEIQILYDLTSLQYTEK